MITVELNDAEVERILSKIGAHLTDMSDLMNEIGEQLEFQTVQRFNEGLAPDGTAWAPKSQATLDAYKRRGQTVDVRPLFGPNADGVPLRNSMFRDYGPDFVEIGTNKIYAAVMQFGAAKGAFGTDAGGSSIPWGAIPARPFLGISDQDRTNIAATVDEWLEGIVED
jgi:phage virion morphogenesis protein